MLSLDCDAAVQPEENVILGKVYDDIGFGDINDNTLRSLAIARKPLTFLRQSLP